MGRFSQGTLPAVGLVFVVAWALAAVLMLTSTSISAQQIDGRVNAVTTQVRPIDRDLDAVKLAATTGRVSGRIRQEAAPLSGLLREVNTESIDETAQQLIKPVKEINTKAKAINGKVKAINGKVKAINSTAGSINSTVNAINANARSINARVNSIEANAASINASVDGIDTSLRGTLDEARSIDSGAAGINRRTSIATDQVNQIKGNTERIIAQVAEINENAAAIENSPVVTQPSVEGLVELLEEAGLTEDLLGQLPDALGGLLGGDPAAPVSSLTGGGGLLGGSNDSSPGDSSSSGSGGPLGLLGGSSPEASSDSGGPLGLLGGSNDSSPGDSSSTAEDQPSGGSSSSSPAEDQPSDGSSSSSEEEGGGLVGGLLN